jgi:hypothetical protein
MPPIAAAFFPPLKSPRDWAFEIVSWPQRVGMRRGQLRLIAHRPPLRQPPSDETSRGFVVGRLLDIPQRSRGSSPQFLLSVEPSQTNACQERAAVAGLDSCVWLLVPRCPGPAAPLLHPPEGPGSENLILVPMPKQPTGTPSEKPPAPSVQEKTGPVPFHCGRPKPIPIVRVEAEGRRFNAVLAPFGSAPYRTCPGEHGTRRTALGGGQAGEVGYARAPGRSLKESVTLGQRDALPACLPDARYGTWLCFG